MGFDPQSVWSGRSVWGGWVGEGGMDGWWEEESVSRLERAQLWLRRNEAEIRWRKVAIKNKKKEKEKIIIIIKAKGQCQGTRKGHVDKIDRKDNKNKMIKKGEKGRKVKKYKK